MRNKIKKVLLEYTKKEKKPYDFGCMMLYYDIPEWNKFLSTIDVKDLYEEEDNNQFGLEHEPHVTILYGLHSDKIEDDELFDVLSGFNPKISLKNISLFNNPNYDVVKFDVEGDELFDMNKTLTDRFPYSTDYPDYHPHSTIAYVKPGLGQKYVRELSEPFVLQPNKLVYSKPDGSKITRNLNHV